MIDWEAIKEKHADDVPYDPTLRCDDCGQPIREWDGYYNVEGWIYCEDCMLKHYYINK